MKTATTVSIEQKTPTAFAKNPATVELTAIKKVKKKLSKEGKIVH